MQVAVKKKNKMKKKIKDKTKTERSADYVRQTLITSFEGDRKVCSTKKVHCSHRHDFFFF